MKTTKRTERPDGDEQPTAAGTAADTPDTGKAVPGSDPASPQSHLSQRRPRGHESKPLSVGIKIVFSILILWGAIIAIGTFRTPASTDFRRSLIVALTMGAFLGTWAIALWASRRSRRSPGDRL